MAPNARMHSIQMEQSYPPKSSFRRMRNSVSANSYQIEEALSSKESSYSYPSDSDKKTQTVRKLAGSSGKASRASSGTIDQQPVSGIVVCMGKADSPLAPQDQTVVTTITTTTASAISTTNSAISTISQLERPVLRTPLAALLSRTQARAGESTKMLVTINVMGSAGPLRFLVDVGDTVNRVIEMALRAYAREGRLPVLGSNSKLVDLYCPHSDFKALDPGECIGRFGTRQFFLYRKKPEEVSSSGGSSAEPSPQRKPGHSHSLKHWWNFMSSIVCSH